MAYGIKDENGKDVIFPDTMTPEQIEARITEVRASIAAKGLGAAFVAEPGATGTGSAPVPAPAATTETVWPEATKTAPTTSTNAGTSSSGSGGGSSSWENWSDGGSGYSSGGSRYSGGSTSKRTSYSDDEDSGSAFTADDFMDQAKGDRTKATAMAKAANKKRRTKRTKPTRSSTFPSREPTPLRTSILAALNESMGKGR